MKKIVVNIFPRNKYAATAGGKLYIPRDRKRLLPMVGGADEVHVHTRVYARDTNVTLDFDCSHGCLGDESPAEGARLFSFTKSGTTPALPYDGTSMPTLPDDGTLQVSPKMGLGDITAKAAGAVGSIEFESWATLIYKNG